MTIKDNFDRLWSLLVPMQGKCDTLEGELLRAIGKIEYDFYNNGFANSWTGAYNFLNQHECLRPMEAAVLRPYASGIKNLRSYEKAAIREALASIKERVVRRVLNVAGDYTPNAADMHNSRPRKKAA